MPSQERLMSYLLEGLRDRQLFMLLFGKNHTNFEECCYDAQMLEDNCNFLQSKASSSSTNIIDMGKMLDIDSIAEAILQKMKQETRSNESYPLRQYFCEFCEDNHPTNRCPSAYPLKWCDICWEMTNHESRECYHCPRLVHARKLEQPSQVFPIASHREKPIVGMQLPLLSTSNMRTVEAEGTMLLEGKRPKMSNHGKNISLRNASSYASSHENNQPLMQRETEKGHVLEGHAQNTSPLSESIEPCMEDPKNHGKRDHHAKQVEKAAPREAAWPKVLRYCSACGNDHLSSDCPLRPVPREPLKETSLNMVETIPSPSNIETTSLNIVTRAQAKQQDVKEPDTLETKTKPKKRKRRKTKKPPKSDDEENGNKNSNELQNEPQILPEEISKTSSGGSVLMEKVNENLEALLKAFDARITSNTVLPPKLQEYPYPIQEKQRLAEHMKLIKEMQTKWEAPPKEVDRIPRLSPTLETIDEEHSLRSKLENMVVPDSEPSFISSDKVRINPEEVNHQDLWDEIRELKQDQASFEKGEAPLTMIGSSLFEINE